MSTLSFVSMVNAWHHLKGEWPVSHTPFRGIAKLSPSRCAPISTGVRRISVYFYSHFVPWFQFTPYSSPLSENIVTYCSPAIILIFIPSFQLSSTLLFCLLFSVCGVSEPTFDTSLLYASGRVELKRKSNCIIVLFTNHVGCPQSCHTQACRADSPGYSGLLPLLFQSTMLWPRGSLSVISQVCSKLSDRLDLCYSSLSGMSLLSLSALETIAISEVLPLVLVSFLLLRFWGLLLFEITTRRTKIFLKNQGIATGIFVSLF